VRRCAAFALLTLLVAPGILFSRTRSFQNPPAVAAHAPWRVLDNCVYVPNQANDGDSFHVSVEGRRYLFRIYFVDAPETDNEFKDRVDEQAKYFGINESDVVQVGKIAREFTREKLAQPFTVRTCFQDALGRSRMQRLYAVVQTATGDLAEQLVENGLARIHGASANPVGLPSANVEWQKLRHLEVAARTERVGGWGVNFGRIMARSEKSMNRAPVDPFEAFFHPELLPVAGAAAANSPSTQATALPEAIVSINPAHAAVQPRPTPEFMSAVASSKEKTTVNINIASQQQLEDLPGIGPVLAQRIIAARPFKSADDLRVVKGIGDTRYQKLRPFFE
jgi:DNA uptake protein ComE-like DNA-binding protein/endonuclease YncB( thermonuclease family)